MIKLNRFYHFDYKGLAEYLHNESLNGNHIVYVSNTFLIFKQGMPEKRYYSVVPNNYRTIEKVEKEMLYSVPSITVYYDDEPLTIPLKKMRVNWDLVFLILFTIGGILMFLAIKNQNDFYLANSGYFILVGSCLWSLLIGFPYLYHEHRKHLKYKANGNKGVYKTMLANGFSIISMVCFTLIFLIAFGFNFSFVIALLVIIVQRGFPIKSRAIYSFFAVIMVVALSFYAMDSHDASQTIIPDAGAGGKSYRYSETLLVPIYETYFKFPYGTDKSLYFEYYKTNMEFVKDDLLKYIDSQDYKFNELLQLDGFDVVKKDSYGRYYFETKNQVLIIGWETEEENVIDFAKEKMGV